MEPHHIFLVVWVIVATTLAATLYLKGKKALALFPPISSKEMLFREKGISGFSRKSILTKLGGANNVLEIVVTKDELWIRSPLLFAGFSSMYDLLHKVQLTQVSNVEINNKKVIIAFISNQKKETTIELKMKKARAFVDLINKELDK